MPEPPRKFSADMVRCSFSLMVTLVWLYITLLRLLASILAAGTRHFQKTFGHQYRVCPGYLESPSGRLATGSGFPKDNPSTPILEI